MGVFKTALLLAALSGLLGMAGLALGGPGGLMIALLLSAGLNLFAYWGSDGLVLRMHGARQVDERTAPGLVRMVRRLADRAGLPMPKVYVIDTAQPNAFATGRSPDHAAVAATIGLLRGLSEREIAAVMAHELAHIEHRDTLIMTITATLAGAISSLANMAMFASLFGGNREGGSFGALGTLLMMILAPMAATLVQLAISRTREYAADRRGAEICGEPMALADALVKINQLARGTAMPSAEANPATAHLFIHAPLGQHGWDSLFATHPNPQNRVAALVAMAGAAPSAQPAAAGRPGRRSGTFNHAAARSNFGPWGRAKAKPKAAQTAGPWRRKGPWG